MTLLSQAVRWFALPPEQLWRKALGLLGFAATQAVVQTIGFVVGLLIVRSLSMSDYAYYTLAVSMVGIGHEMLLLGLGNAMLAQGGPLLKQPSDLARLMADVLAYHRQLSIALLPLLAAGFASMFAYHKASALQVGMLTALVALGAMLQVRNSLSVAVVRLYGERPLQQKLDLGANTGRALLVATLMLVGLSAPIAVSVNVVAAAAVCVCLQRWLAKHLGTLPVPDGQYRPALRALVGRQAANSVYYCVSGQVTIWLVALLGNTQSLAEVGALGRIAVLFTIIGAVVAAIVQPYFARHSEPRTLVSAFIAVNAFFCLLTLALWGGACAFPSQILWILGGSYQNLQEAVPWLVLASCVTAWFAAVYAIGGARGWVVPAASMILSGVLAIAGSIVMLDVATPTGACMMSCVTAATAAVVALWFVSRQLRDYRRDFVARGAP